MRGGFAVLAVLAVAACVGAQQNQASAPFLDTQLVSNVSARPALGFFVVLCLVWLDFPLNILKYTLCGGLYMLPMLIACLVETYLGAPADQQLLASRLALSAH